MGRPLWLVSAASAAVLTGAALSNWTGTGPAGHLIRAVERVPRSAHAVWRLAGGTAELDAEYNQNMEALSSRFETPAVVGSVDVYPWDVWIPLARDFAYDPRPVFQSYSAYTPELAEANLQHLLGPEGPRSILFSVKTIDGRFPALDDGLSWPVLLARYDVTFVAADMILLRRAERPRTVQTRVLERARASLGRPIPLPPHSGPLLISLDIKPTVAGRLWAMAYKNAPLEMVVWTQDEREHYYKLIPTMAKTPFLISPLMERTSSFAALATGTVATDLLVERIVVRRTMVQRAPSYLDDFDVVVTSLELSR